METTDVPRIYILTARRVYSKALRVPKRRATKTGAFSSCLQSQSQSQSVVAAKAEACVDAHRSLVKHLRQRMVKSRQRKLDERFGVEQSAKGGRFKLNRDLVSDSFLRGVRLPASLAHIDTSSCFAHARLNQTHRPGIISPLAPILKLKTASSESGSRCRTRTNYGQ